MLGTAAYMSPEQARGQAVDKRADIWAFGVVLYEMLTGRQAFTGETISDTLAAVLRAEVDWEAVPAGTPASIRKLLRRCLTRDRKQRLQAIGEARIALEEQLADPAGSSVVMAAPALPVQPAWQRALPWALAGVLALALLLAGISLYRLASREERVVRAFIPAPPGTVFDLDGVSPGPVTLSPDGSKLAFTARDEEGKVLLWVREIDSVAARPLSGTEDAQYPFWSADSRSVGFIANGKLKKIDAAGGPPLSLADAPNGKGGTWNRDGVILFAPGPSAPIHRVPEAGGESTPLTEINTERGENSHRHPWFLPDGRHFLFVARISAGLAGEEGSAVLVGSLDGAEPRLLMRSESNALYASGHLLFVRENTLMARPFDPGALEFTGDAFPLAEDVQYITGGAMAGVFSASQNGVLAYLTGEAGGYSQLRWLGRNGRELGTVGGEAAQFDVRLSPDQRRVAVARLESASGVPDIWIYEIDRGIATRFTFDPTADVYPVWSPDGRRIAFASRRGGGAGPDIYLKPYARSGEAELLLADDQATLVPTSFSRDGRYLSYLSIAGDTVDLWVLPLEGDRKPIAFVQTPFLEGDGQFSPDGKWLAYASHESGRWEIYVTPFPGPGRKWQISTAGGSWARWRGDGREIYYHAPDGALMAVAVRARGDSLEINPPERLVENIGAPNSQLPAYDAAADGRRFLVNLPAAAERNDPLTLVVNWPADLKE
ncbi:MAG: protein kinase [Kiloniellales bacterium]